LKYICWQKLNPKRLHCKLNYQWHCKKGFRRVGRISLEYLRFGKKLDHAIFSTPPSTKIASILQDLIERIRPTQEEGEEQHDGSSEQVPQSSNKWKESEIQKAINDAMWAEKSGELLVLVNILLAAVKKEMNLFKNGCSRGLHVQSLGLASRNPSDQRRIRKGIFFGGIVCTKLRCRMEGAILDSIRFLRAYFQQQLN